MKYAHLGAISNTPNFEFSFHYTYPELGIDREYYFNHRRDLSVESLLIKVTSVIKQTHIGARKKKREANTSNDSKETNDKKNEKTTEEYVGPPIVASFHRYGNIINKNYECKDILNSGVEMVFKLADDVYTVLINMPHISNIELPTCIFVNYPVYPVKFETVFVDKDKSSFIWYKSNDRNTWKLVGSEYAYTPIENDVGCYLKLECMPQNSKDVGPYFKILSSTTVQQPPRNMPFEKRHNFTMNGMTENSFRIVSYNTLADHYCKTNTAKSDRYPYCDINALHIDYRKQLIMKELLGYKADIICLQEVDYKVYKSYFRPMFSKNKFKGIYNPKEAKPEGLACFYNSSRFTFIRATSIVIGKSIEKENCLANLWSKLSKNKPLKKRLTEQNTILQVVVLKSNENDNILLVANTHLYFHPEASHIRLLQAAISCLYIENMFKQTKKKFKNSQIAVVFCGDFNSKPESAVYRLFTKGSVPETCEDWTSNKDECVTNVSINLPWRMKSAYGTPKYTNYTEDFKACLDYIFYKNNLQLTQVVPLPTEEEMSAHTALPSVVVPSDHVALVADFKWLPNS